MVPDFQICSDEELARQCQAGSLSAYEALVYRYEDRIHGFVTNSCRNSADAREVTQDTFVRAFQAINQFDCRRAFAPWLFAIARHKCIDHHRATPKPVDAHVTEWADDNDPSELLARQEDRQGLWRLAQKHLPGPQFQALWLKYAEDMDVGDIAQVLRKTKTHIKVLLFRARRTLCQHLKVGHGAALLGGDAALRATPTREAARSPAAGGRSGDTLSRVAGCSALVIGPEPGGARKVSV